MATAQLQKNHWYFGEGAAISFDGGTPTTLYDNPLTAQTQTSACISDAKTGELLFYTNGYEVRNADHTICENGAGIAGNNATDVLILSDPFNEDQYYLFMIHPMGAWPSTHLLVYHKVVKNDQGTFTVTPEEIFLTAGNFNKITAVKNCRNGGYWLLYFQSQTESGFYAYSIGPKGVSGKPVISPNTSGIDLGAVGDIVSNHDGTQIAVTDYAPNGSVVLLLDFDKKCGVFTLNKTFTTSTPEREYAYGIAFSPNNNYLFVTYSVGRSELWQINVPGGNETRIFLSHYSMNELQTGPDGRIYISTSNAGLPSPRINVMHRPNLLGFVDIKHEQNFLNLGSGRSSNSHFPNFIQDYSEESCKDQYPEFENHDLCQGDSAKLLLKNGFVPEGDYYWRVHKQKISDLEPQVHFNNPSIDTAWFLREICDEWDSTAVVIKVNAMPRLKLSDDTVACGDDTLHIQLPEIEGATYKWLPPISQSHKARIAEAGTYIATVDNNGCTDSDTLVLTTYPGIWVELGKEYFICDNDSEMVRLDAGEGFAKYRWFPTSDSTQWIDVSRIDTYYVVVRDFRGCTGDGGTRVKRQCPHYIYFPTGFTPDGNNLNERFGPIGQDLISFDLEIYNRWGECVFTSTDPSVQWDGTFMGVESPADQYLYRCHYRGLNAQKKPVSRFVSGKVILMR